MHGRRRMAVEPFHGRSAPRLPHGRRLSKLSVAGVSHAADHLVRQIPTVRPPRWYGSFLPYARLGFSPSQLVRGGRSLFASGRSVCGTSGPPSPPGAASWPRNQPTTCLKNRR
jgi:hypothetical protein